MSIYRPLYEKTLTFAPRIQESSQSMKRSLTILLLFIATISATAQSAALHPRLFLNDAQMAVLQKRIAEGNEYVMPLHALVMEQADASLNTPAPSYTFDESGLRLLHQSRAAIRRIASCSYAWRETGDTRYRDCVLADLNTVCAFPNWNGPRHFLDAAEMALAVAVGCDWLWNELPDTLLEHCRQCVQTFAFTPALNPRPHWFYNTIGNWNQVCNGGLTIAALSLWERGEDTMADEIVAKAIESNRKPMEGIYGPDGAYPEGPIYWNYGTMFEALFLTALEDATGSDSGLYDSPGFSRTAFYETMTIGTSGQNFNYGDNLSSDYCASALWYFAWKQSDPSKLIHEQEVLDSGEYVNVENERFLTFQLCYAARMNTDVLFWRMTKTPLDHFFGHGTTPVMMVKNTYSSVNGDRYVGVKGGSAGNSHGHMDAGSLVYDAWGKRWIMDPDRQEYAPLEVLMAREGGSLFDLSQNSLRWKLLRFRNEAHSTLTINGAQHNVRGSASMIDSHFASNRNDRIYCTFDLSSVFQGEAQYVSRRVELIDKRDLLIVDTIVALPEKEAWVRFNIVTPADVKVAERKNIQLSQGGHTLTLRARVKGKVKENIRFTTWSNDPADYDSPFANDEPCLDATICGYTVTIPAGGKAVLISRLE